MPLKYVPYVTLLILLFASFVESNMIYNYSIDLLFLSVSFGQNSVGKAHLCSTWCQIGQLDWIWSIQDGTTHMTGALALAADWGTLILFLMVFFSSWRV